MPIFLHPGAKSARSTKEPGGLSAWEARPRPAESGSPSGPDPGSAPVTGSGPQGKPWIHAPRLALEKEPLDLGYSWDHTHYIRIPQGIGQNS